MIQNIETKVSVFGQIKTNTSFYYRKLPTRPSKLAEIQYSVRFANVNKTVSLDIYTTEVDLKVKTKCSHNHFGQLRNEDLHTPMKPRSGPYRSTKCVLDINASVTHCEGRTTIQDYKPRNYGFSFGYHCKYLYEPLLLGLSFNFTISEQTNKTTCTKVPNVEDVFLNCHQLYTFTSFPNMIGFQNNSDLEDLKNTAASLIFGLMFSDGRLCHKYAREILCHIISPRCDSVKLEVIYPCTELFEDFNEACSGAFSSSIRKLDFPGTLFSLGFQKGVNTTLSDVINYNYLPTINDTVPCFYTPVTCQSPPNVPNAKKIDSNQHNRTYVAKSELKYQCLHETYQMEGNSTVICLFSGEWNEIPKCLKRSNKHPNLNLSIIVLSLVIVTSLIIFILLQIIRK